MKRHLLCLLGLHRWVTTARVSPPLWDISARGLLQQCNREACDKVRAL